MITAAGCQARRRRLLDAKLSSRTLVLADPLSLRYFANFYADPFSLGADYLGVLVIEPEGRSVLYHDSRAAKSVQAAFVDERVPLVWYDGKSAGRGSRRLLMDDAIRAHGGRVHDDPSDGRAQKYWPLVDQLRRSKFPDEVDQLRACMRATEVGHAWARDNVRAGLSELDVYIGIAGAVTKHLGNAAVVYGDFAVSPGAAKRGGPPDDAHALKAGETLILDFSVVLGGYRSDFTNTLCVGGKPSAKQKQLLDACQAAMSAGEAQLRAGAACRAVYDAVRGAFADAGLADAFPHHAGHGLGLSHPEPPMLVEHATETLVAGDVVTLEPGVYVDGVGGVRIEHNYLVTASGFEQLSHHAIGL